MGVQGATENELGEGGNLLREVRMRGSAVQGGHKSAVVVKRLAFDLGLRCRKAQAGPAAINPVQGVWSRIPNLVCCDDNIQCRKRL